MKKILFSSLFVFLLAVGINAQTMVTLGGNVYYQGIVGSLPQEPAPGVTVTMKKTIIVNGSPQVSTETTSTDSSGFFSFSTEAQCNGTWEFTAVSPLVIDDESLPISNQASVSGCVTSNITNLQMKITRPYPITVSGHIKDTNGVPVPGAFIVLETNKYDYDPDLVTQKGTFTDAAGFYSFQVYTRCSVAYSASIMGADGNLYPMGSTSGCVYLDKIINRTVTLAERAFWMHPDLGCKMAYEIVRRPVNVTNGNVYLWQKDYSVPGAGEALNVTRTYNSLSTYSGLFGASWTTQYDERISASNNFLLRLQLPEGRLIHFVRKNDSSPFTPYTAGFYGQIVKNTDNTFTLTFKDGRTHSFSSAGVLTSLTDRHNNQTVLNYDGLGRLASIVDPFGRTLTVSTDGAGRVTGLSDTVGTVAAYVYNTNGTLQSVTYADNSKFTFTYTTHSDSSGTHRLLTEIKDALNNVVEKHDYYTNGKAQTSEVDNGVEKYTLTYTSPTQTTATDALNRTTDYYFGTIGGVNVVTKTEGLCGGCGGGDGETNEYFYDAQKNVTKKINALGHEIIYTYDANGNMLTQTDPTGTRTYTYNSYGQILTATDQMNGIITVTYNAQGKPIEIKDPLNKITTLDYYSTGELKSMTDARSKTTNYLWEDGNLKRITDANSKQTNFVFDARGRVTTVTNALAEVTTYNYDLNNRIKKIIYPDTKFVEYKYDLGGRLEWIQDARGNKTTYGYDTLSSERLKTVTDALNHTTTYGYDLMSNVTSVTDAEGKTTDYTIDNFNRLEEITYPPAATSATRLKETFTYDDAGHLTARTDAANRVTSFEYDTAERLKKVTNPESEVTQYEYNARSQLTKVKDALNQEYSFTYDALGRQLSKTRGGGATMTHEYDAVGNKIKRTDYYGSGVTTYGYDNLNRLQTINYLDLNAPHLPLETVTYTYDDLSRMLTATNYAGTVSFTYDNRSRIASTTDVHGHELEYEYDENGNRTLLKLDQQNHTSYVYDAANRLTTLTDEANQNFAFGYDVTDRLTTKTLPNNVVTTYNYDGLSRLTRLKHQSGSNTLVDNQYTYNAAQQISQITELTQTRTFTYDDADRLTAATNPTLGNENYSYDSVGNRTASHLNSVYDYQGYNQLLQTDFLSYGYVANGSIGSVGDGSMSPGWYGWDYEVRMTSAKNAGYFEFATSNHEYDALGRRVSRTFQGDWEKYTYDGVDVVLDESNNGNTTYQNAPDIDNKLKLKQSGNENYFLPDHLGSTIGLTNASGSLVASENYDSFGNSTNSLTTRYRYTGREYDSHTGLYYYRARWYDSRLGKFVSEDPIGFEGGDVNLYGYVKNNPVNFTDPFGEQPTIFFPRLPTSQIAFVGIQATTRECACPVDNMDVQMMQAQFNKNVVEMTQDGFRPTGSVERFNSFGGAGSRTWYSFGNNQYHGWRGNGLITLSNLGITQNYYLGCGDQAEVLRDSKPLFPQRYVSKSKWNKPQEVSFPFRIHNWNVVTSDNPNDPIIYLDSWGNEFKCRCRN